MPFVVLIRRRSCHCLGKFIVLILIWMSMVCSTSSLRNALNVMLAVTCNYSRFLEFTQNTFCYRSRDGLYHCRICRALVMDPVIPGADCLFLLLLVLPAELALYFGGIILFEELYSFWGFWARSTKLHGVLLDIFNLWNETKLLSP